MLTILVSGIDLWDELHEEFTKEEPVILELEHSLVSLSKWESFYEKPFLGKEDKSTEEVLTYIRMMCLSPEISPEVFQRLSSENLADINEYIDAKMSATWFYETGPQQRSSETITAELVYYWMISLSIPIEFQNWHLNRLFTLIKVFNVKNSKPKKMTGAEIAQRNRELNDQRKAQLGTHG